jgi:hypothetical protein
MPRSIVSPVFVNKAIAIIVEYINTVIVKLFSIKGTKVKPFIALLMAVVWKKPSHIFSNIKAKKGNIIKLTIEIIINLGELGINLAITTLKDTNITNKKAKNISQ